MNGLRLDDFDAYFEAVHGCPPFRWQRRLLHTVQADGWPDQLDLPTGSGKTAALDVALFHMALEAERDPSDRTAPRRVFLVVDRRLIVDQAHDRAERIARELREATEGILRRVADALRSLGGAGEPVVTALLRGGLPRDRAWARTPDQPVLGVSTVDQVGSRLLFRGYGVSDSMRPLEAGLLGNDTLFLLDEVHLAQPFADTLDALRDYRAHPQPQALCPRWRAVALSATPRGTSTRSFGLDPDDRHDQALDERLRARKPVALFAVPAKGEEDQRRDAFVQACATQARRLRSEGAHTVAVLVNRVDTARRVFAALAEDADALLASEPRTHDAERVLLTGRMRPLDRDDVQRRLGRRLAAGRDDNGQPRNVERPLLVVATQCLEAGADYDFDALVSECASLDALRQRFGRLDRLGRHGQARGVVLVRDDQVKAGADDPIYGPALAATWEWLSAQLALDFGYDALRPPTGGALARLLPAPRTAPVMLPAHLDAWAQTSFVPAVDPEAALWLHGPRAEPPDVQIVWRADLDVDALDARAAVTAGWRAKRDFDDTVSDRLELCPPRTCEALSVPLAAARRWLDGQPASPLADVEGTSAQDDDERAPRATRPGRAVLRWRNGQPEVVMASKLAPGDLLVVPAAFGGIDPVSRTWAPESRASVDDLGDLAQLHERRRPVLRLTREYLTAWKIQHPPEVDENSDATERKQALRAWLDGLGDVPERLMQVVTPFREGTDWRVVGDLALVAPRPRGTTADVSTEPDVSSFTETAISLAAHCQGVESKARDFARRCGLPPDLAKDVALAARLHDLGKADPRFQAWLRNDVAPADELLAKSRLPLGDRRARHAARALSGYPEGGRHEFLSVALVDGSALLRAAQDPDLVLHLVASHHGFARPFAPFAPDDTPRDVTLSFDGAALHASSAHGYERVGSPVPERFWRVLRRYGWYGLAWLEAILRLADHRCSEQEAAQPRGDEA